jgi:hypothetical protein
VVCDDLELGGRVSVIIRGGTVHRPEMILSAFDRETEFYAVEPSIALAAEFFEGYTIESDRRNY